MTETIMTLFGPEVKVKKEYKKRPLKERFDEKWIPEPNSGCWLWEASVNNENYGQIGVNVTIKGAHRVSYELYKGDFDKKLHIRHKCDNTYCVNPDHLEPGTNQDNMNDKVKRGRQASTKLLGEKNGNSKLTEEQVIAIFNDTRDTEKIAEDYGISSANVSAIKTGFTWNHVTGKKYENRRLKEEQVKEIYIKIHNGYKIKDLVKEYNITYDNVIRIKNGRRWAWFTKDIKI